MVNRENLGAMIQRWADDEPSVGALVLIGSQVREGEKGIGSPDTHSDWDYQVVTSDPDMFCDAGWLHRLGSVSVRAYVERQGRLGTARKVTALLECGELDLIVIPTGQVSLIAQQVETGAYVKNKPVSNALADQAAVLQGGYRILKGQAEYGNLFHFIATEIGPRRLDDDAVRSLAEGFVCDYVSTRHKIERGEVLAAQRWLHQNLAETNFQLLHELRRRSAKLTLPDARRIELMVEANWLRAVEIQALPTAESLRAATNKSRETCCRLMQALVGDTWRWPTIGA